MPGIAASSDHDNGRPWFRRWPREALVVSIVMFAGVFVLRLSVADPEDAVALLFCLPVALLAVTFGVRGGTIAGLVAVALVAAWTVVDDVGLSSMGWLARIFPLLLLGTLVGIATDRLHLAEQRQRALWEAAQRERSAAEINDTIVQGLAAAKWALEAGRVDRGLEVISDTLDVAQGLVSELLRDTGAGRVVGGRADDRS